MSRTLLSIDLDWLNDAANPLDKLCELLHHIPKTTPVIMTVEHHEFLPQLHRWIESGKVKIPFNIINIDEHHDYYQNMEPHDPDGTAINCGNWGFRLPIEWYDRYTWVHNTEGMSIDWDKAKRWLDDRRIKHSMRGRHRLKSLKSKIIAAVFCVSPDYLSEFMTDKDDIISDAIEIVVKYFDMDKAPLRISNTKSYDVNGWRIAPRPVKVS